MGGRRGPARPRAEIDGHGAGVQVTRGGFALRGRVFARFGDEGQRCVLSGALDDSIGVMGFGEPEQGTREEEVGVIILGGRRRKRLHWW